MIAPDHSGVKQLSDIIGDWGLWQTNIALCCITAAAFSSLNGLASSFYAPTIDFYCSDLSIPGKDQCQLNGTKCSTFHYHDSLYGLTAVKEWDLVCDSSYLSSLSQSAYMIGIVFSALIFGYCSDKFGRKPTVLVAIVIEICSGFLSAYSNSITMFIITRFLLAFGCYGRNLTGILFLLQLNEIVMTSDPAGFLMGIESVGTNYRAVLGMAYQLGWAFGYILLPGLAYWLQNFRHLLIATTVPEVIWFIWFSCLPESPRWLLTHDKSDEAEEIVMQAVKRNVRNEKDVKEMFKALKENMDREREAVTSNSPSSMFLGLFKDRTLIMLTLAFYFTWFTNAFVYYGISLNIGDLNGNLYWNFFFAGLVEFPSYLFCMFIFKYIGRRPLLAAMMFGSGISCLSIIPFFAVGMDDSQWIHVFAMIGKFCITSSFGIIYVYSAEVYPTALRQIGVGSCSVAGRVGSIIAPFIKELVS